MIFFPVNGVFRVPKASADFDTMSQLHVDIIDSQNAKFPLSHR